jgi:excisionase family DNA binding protein
VTPTPDRLVDAPIVADVLGVSVREVQRKAQRGELPSFRIGRLLRFSIPEVLDALRRPAKEGARDE